MNIITSPISVDTPTKSSKVEVSSYINPLIQCRVIDEIELGENIKSKQCAIDEYFKNYFDEREKEKKRIYQKVTSFGFVIFIVSFYFFYSIYWLLNGGILWAIGMILPTLTRVIGLGIMSTVPSNRYDLFDGCIQNKKYMYGLSFLCGIVLQSLFSTMIIYLYPNPPFVYNYLSVSLPLYFFVLWHARTFIGRYPNEETEYFWFFTKVKCNFLLIIYANIALCFNLIISHHSIQTFSDMILVRSIISLVSFIPVILYYTRQGLIGKWKEVAVKMQGAKDFFEMSYISCFALGINYLGASIVCFSYGDNFQAVVWFLTGTADLLPMLFIYITGNEKCFSLTCRYFETDIKRLQTDGATMAALVASAQVFAKDEKGREVVWIKREKECTKRKEIGHYINSRYWMKGIIERNKDSPSIVKVRVIYNEDIDPTTSYCYSNNFLKRAVVDNVSLSIPFDTWISENFSPEKEFDFKSFTENFESKGVEFVKILKSSEQDSLKTSTPKHKNSYNVQNENCVRLTLLETSLKADTLLDYAQNNLKKFDSSKFTDDLLVKSPRELGDDNEKIVLYARSDNLVLKTKRDKIDYFISHSWYIHWYYYNKYHYHYLYSIRSDDAEIKCCKLKDLIEKQIREKKRAPTFWLDKVCIDQIKPIDGVSVLPININACNKMLIMLGKTYLSRLWCLWELFTLCTFCNDELALERIEIVLLDDYDDICKQLDNFKIDEAHCFDPNEEYKLGYIFNMIGHDSLDKIIKLLKQKLQSLQHCTSKVGI